MVGSLYIRLSHPDDDYELLIGEPTMLEVSMRVLGSNTFWDICLIKRHLSSRYQFITDIFI